MSTDEMVRTEAADEPRLVFPPKSQHLHNILHGRRGAAILGIVAFCALWASLYALSVHSFQPNSDASVVMMEGQAMVHGNLTLQGWFLSLDSFWLLDALVYAPFVGLFGPVYGLFHLVPALVATGVVAVGTYLAASGRRRLPAVVAALTVFALIGLPTTFLAKKMLQSPVHVVTTLWCLLAFACLRRGRFDWRFALAIVLLGTAIVSDLIALAVGTVPVLVAGLVVMARHRSGRAGVVPVVGALSGLAVAFVLRAGADLVGTFSMHAHAPTAHGARLTKNIGLSIQYLANLFGMGSASAVRGAVPALLVLAHYAAVVVGVALVVVLGRLVRDVARGERPGPELVCRAPADDVPVVDGGRPALEAGFIDQVLLLGVVGSVCSFIGLAVAGSPPEGRYLVPAAIFASVITGGVLADLTDRLNGCWWRRVVPVGAAVVVLIFGAGAGYQLTTAMRPPPFPSLANFLVAHHLDQGVADFWTAAVVTVASKDEVSVRPVRKDKQGQLVPDLRGNADSSWFQGRLFTFFVYASGDPDRGVNAQSAERTFGPPSEGYFIAGYHVMVWATPHRLG